MNVLRRVSLGGEYKIYSTDGAYSFCGRLPGSDFGNMIACGLIKNPAEIIDGEALAREVALKDFVFEREFAVDPRDLEYKNAELFFEQLDTLCSVFLNGERVLSTENAHISYSADVKKYLKPGGNLLKLVFSSPLRYIEKRQAQRALPPNGNGVNGAQYLRKANCAFGWDWGPCIPYNYVGRTELRFFNFDEIKNIRISQNTGQELSVVTVSAENAETCVILPPSGEMLLPEKVADGSFVFRIENPELWYTRDLSEKERQPLYTVCLGSGEMQVERKIGLRRIRLVREADEFGENFQFEINGKRIFAKGANVIPFAAIPEYAEGAAEYYTSLAAESNFNMLRIWGGGEYAGEKLLDLCDELGILVWQDFCFACMMYPLDEPDFVKNVLREAEFNIKRMSHRACLAVFCGNNEIEEMNAAFVNLVSLRKGYVDYFYNLLPETVKRLCDTDYIPTSPLGKAPFSHNSDENLGDCHMWAVWHGLLPSDWYGTRFARFLSEFGMESLPSKRAIEKFAPGETSVYSKPFIQHQKCADGNRKMMYYLCEKFSKNAEFADLPYLTGIMQAECIQAATGHFRRNKGRCNGSVFWQLNDVWCAPSWSAVDFERVPKALMYKAREFFAPVAVTFADGRVYLHNDTLYDKTLTVSFKKYHGERLTWQCEKKVLSPADSVKVICEIGLFENELLCVDLNGRAFWFDNGLRLERANILCRVEGNRVIVCTDTFAKNVCIECSGGIPRENYFCLAPGEEKCVVTDGEPGDVRVLCENNISFGGSAASEVLFRFFYRLKPVNLLSYMWHRMK